MEAGLALSVWEAAEYFGGRGVPGPLGSAHRMSAPYQAFRCADGYLTVGAANQRTFEKLAGVLGHAEWTGRSPFRHRRRARAPSRTAGPAIDAATVAETHGPDGWSVSTPRASRAARSSITPRRSTRRRRRPATCRVIVDHPALGRVRTIGTPLKLSRTPLDASRRAPRLGEHADEVLQALGYSTAEVAALRAAGALG